VKQPGIDQEAVFRDGEVVAEFRLSDARRRIVRVIMAGALENALPG
jgi:hypothetical protein